ncbi:MAG: hypothetical protein KI790_02080 [Cyclobacteriaceae bacterium]|nr:hypothetical protein [Cyclobacteriaceae bacterium HetDA_MAG_MS6]
MKNAVCYLVDDHNHEFLMSSLKSLKEYMPDHPDVVILFAGDDRKRLDALFDPKDRVLIKGVKTKLTSIESISNQGFLKNNVVFYKLLLWSELLDDYDSVLYLDTDTMIQGELTELFQSNDFFIVTDSTNAPQFRLFKPQKANHPKLKRLLSEDNLRHPKDKDDMANAGVFLIPKKYRTTEQFELILSIMLRYDEFLMFADQSIISLWCHINEITFSKDLKYNFQLQFYQGEHFFYHYLLKDRTNLDDIRVVHFADWKPYKKKVQLYESKVKSFLNHLSAWRTLSSDRIDCSDLSIHFSIKIDSNDRLFNLELVLKLLEFHCFGYEVIIVEQGEESLLPDHLLDQDFIRHVFIQSDEVHYKTRNLNLASNLTTRPLIMMCDCDVVVHPVCLNMSLNLLRHDQFDFIMPHNGIMTQLKKSFMHDNQEDLSRFINQLVFIGKNHDLESYPDYDKGSFEVLYGSSKYDNTGGCILYTKESFALSGGWNTNYVSYGFEDMDFVYRLKKLGFRGRKMEDFNLYHLEHERSFDSIYNNYYRSNEQEWQRVNLMDDDSLRSYALKNFKNLVYSQDTYIDSRNTESLYSLEAKKSRNYDLSNYSIVLPIDQGMEYNASWVDDFILDVEQKFSAYELIIVESFTKKSKYLNNKKFVKYLCVDTDLTVALLLDKVEEVSNRSNVLLCQYGTFLDSAEVKNRIESTGENGDDEDLIGKQTFTLINHSNSAFI